MSNKRNIPPPDVLDSKTKKLHIELPDYNFRHSPATSELFLGRKELKDRLTYILTNTSTHQGVYLVTGDRGVGKTSLVEEVIKETSVSRSFSQWLKFLLLTLCVILILQTVLWEVFETTIKWNWGVSRVLGFVIVILAYLLGKKSLYKRRCKRYAKHRNTIRATGRVIRALVKELSFIQDIVDPYVRQLYLIKMALIVCVIMFVSGITDIPPVKLFVVYLSCLLSFVLKKYTDSGIFSDGNNVDGKKIWYHFDNIFILLFVSTNRIYVDWRKTWYHIVDIFILCAIPAVVTLFILNVFKNAWWLVLIVLPFVKLLIFMRPRRRIHIIHRCDMAIHNFIRYFSRYIQNYPRIYIKINFGQDGQSKRDILRLIARNLQASYFKYCSSIKHIFLWRISAFAIILLFTFLFHKYIYIYLPHIHPPEICYSLCLAIDTVVNYIYNGICYLPKYFWYMESGKCDYAFHIHTHINYAFILIFACIYLLLRVILRISTITTPGKIKRQLKDLNDAIAYSIDRVNTHGVNVEKDFIGLHKTRSVKKSRTIADEGEIEMELQAIFVAMHEIPLLMCKPEWVIVFDELDKMEPQTVTDNLTKDNILSIHSSREKQAAILKLLSDMKYFLSTAEAQFIFIAGREMYDIYLADISERNNLLGSIFNDVVFVPSFLSEYTDKDATSDMTSMVEKYVCTHIIPSFYTKFTKDLKGYKQYLDRIIYDNQTECIIEREKERIIACLQQFIFYLTYTSKGAPKKIVQIFESYIHIQTYDEYSHNKKHRNRTKHKYSNTNIIQVKLYRNSVFFLIFDYYDQFMLGMTSYLVAPVMYRFIDSNIQKHSDKLLVSSMRFIDFLFKFHRHNFSWKSLGISPELIEINRAPELKSLAENLTNFFLQTHIEKFYSGLYEYRFDNLISQEISFMSKVSEQFSAMFNFSLDESLALKNYYKTLLKEAREKATDNNIHHAVTSLQIVLGDLHFYDDEFEEAATYYKNGIQSLPSKDKLFANNELQYLYLYIRNMLKLGFVYEKRKQYDFAFLTYSDLCNEVIKRPEIHTLFKDMRLIYLPFLAKLQILEKCHTGGIQQSDIDGIVKDFENMIVGVNEKEVNILRTIFYSRTSDILYYKNRNFGSELPKERNKPCSACFYYQIAISKLLMIQTDSLSTILTTAYSQMKNIAEIKYCHIMAQLLSNLGNVFYACDSCTEAYCIKNQVRNTPVTDNTTPEDVYDVDFWIQWDNFIQSKHDDEKFRKILTAECYTKLKLSIIMYSLSIDYYKKANDHKRSAFQITKILQMLRDYMPVIERFEKATEYIDTLSKKAIQSVYLAYEGITLLEIKKRKKDFGKTHKDPIPLQTILVDSEIKRITVIVKSLKLKLEKKLHEEKIRKTLKDYYASHITSPYGINYSVSARIFRLSLKSTLNWETFQGILSEIIETPNVTTDTNTETNVLPKVNKDKYLIILDFFVKIIKGEQITYIDKIFDYPEFNDNTPCGGNTNNIDIKSRGKFYLTIFEKLVSETIFCFKEIIRLSNTAGETFLFNHKLMGEIYYYLSYWTILLESYLNIKQFIQGTNIIEYLEQNTLDEVIKYKLPHDFVVKLSKYMSDQKVKAKLHELPEYLQDSQIEEYMETYLGKEWRENISGYYDNNNALFHHYKCKETHEEGKAYLDMIDDMYYLGEDFGDRSNHFYIAMERHYINSPKFEDRINQLKKRYEESSLHTVDNYFQQ